VTIHDQGATDRRRLVFVGGGEHALVVLDAAHLQTGWDVVGFIDPRPSPELQHRGIVWWGDDDAGTARLSNESVLLTVGGPASIAVRRALAKRYSAPLRCEWATVIHPSATVAGDVAIGAGTAILAQAVVNPGARIGAHAIINTGVIVEHNVELGTNVQVGPGAVIGGGVTVGDDTFIGIGASLRDHIRIGTRAVVGMGSVVIDDVPDDTVVAGAPASPLRGRRGEEE
jgi:acetyltransferase EpsM